MIDMEITSEPIPPLEVKKMIERSRKPEIYLLLLLGFKPKEIEKLGFSKFTVYKYSAEMPKILERLKAKLIKGG